MFKQYAKLLAPNGIETLKINNLSFVHLQFEHREWIVNNLGYTESTNKRMIC